MNEFSALKAAWHIERAGAKFLIRDDLIVEHVRLGAHATWPAAGYTRNRDLFLRKWKRGP